MILIFDIIIWLLLGIFFINKKYLESLLSVFINTFFFIILKAVLLWIVLWFFYQYNSSNIETISFIINLIIFVFLIFNFKYLKIPRTELNILQWFIVFFILCIISLGIYNIIPYWWDELMYHLPISIELLNKWTWMSDLWLTYYWHNNIWQWYPKNLYFVIDYFFVSFEKTIIWIQAFGIFAFLFFFSVLYKVQKFLLEKNNINNWNITLLTTLLSLTIPVVFLHLFIKVDIVFFSLILLLIYNLLFFGNIFFITVLIFLIIWFKIIGIFFVLIIWISFLIYSMIYQKNDLIDFIKKNRIHFILYFLLGSPIFLYSFIYNYFYYENILYPINIIKTDNSSSGNFFWLFYYLRDYIFNDYWNYNIKNQILNYYNGWTYNYDRGLWIMWFLMALWVALFWIFKKNFHKSYAFIVILLIVFLLLSFNKLNLLFWHRYQIFLYVFFVNIFVYSIYVLLKKNTYILYPLLISIIWINIISSYFYIWAFTQKKSWQEQLVSFTTKNYCDKIKKIWDISRDDYRNGWSYICNNIKNKNILAINQVFNFYLYWKDFDNNIHNKVFFNKHDFYDFTVKNKIDYILTSNKNNLYTKFWNDNNSFYSNSTDSNDETMVFCSNQKYSDIKNIYIEYNIDRNDDLIYNFWINNFDKNIILNWNTKSSLNINSKIDNICFMIFDNPKKSIDNKIKTIKFNKIQLINNTGNIINLSTFDFSFIDYAIEDLWLVESGYKKIFTDNFNNLDYFYIWNK